MGKVELNLPMPMYYQLALYPGSSPAENPRFSAGEEPGYKATYVCVHMHVTSFLFPPLPFHFFFPSSLPLPHSSGLHPWGNSQTARVRHTPSRWAEPTAAGPPKSRPCPTGQAAAPRMEMGQSTWTNWSALSSGVLIACTLSSHASSLAFLSHGSTFCSWNLGRSLGMRLCYVHFLFSSCAPT